MPGGYDESDASDTVDRVLVRDVVDELPLYEKIAGLAVTIDRHLWVGLDNDGGLLESRIVDTGCLKDPFGR